MNQIEIQKEKEQETAEKIAKMNITNVGKSKRSLAILPNFNRISLKLSLLKNNNEENLHNYIEEEKEKKLKEKSKSEIKIKANSTYFVNNLKTKNNININESNKSINNQNQNYQQNNLNNSTINLPQKTYLKFNKEIVLNEVMPKRLKELKDNEYLLGLRKEMIEINKYIEHKNIKKANGVEKLLHKKGLFDNDLIKAKKILAEKKQLMSTPERAKEMKLEKEVRLEKKRIYVIENTVKKSEMIFKKYEVHHESSSSSDIEDLSILSNASIDNLKDNELFYPKEKKNIDHTKLKKVDSEQLIQQKPFIASNCNYKNHPLI